jgi:hypothetical protein
MFGDEEVTEDRRFLVLIRIEPADRIPATKWAMDVINGISGENRLAFSSEKGETFGVWVKAKKAAAQIRAALDKQYSRGERTFVMVLELGDDSSCVGNSRGWEWLQHH